MIIPWFFALKEDEQLLVERFQRRWVVNGPAIYLAKPFERVQRRKGITLGPTEYLLLRDTLSGELHNELGPQLCLLEASEEIVAQRTAIPLKSNQYIHLIDTVSGAIRVERGENSIYLKPTEEMLEDVQTGINIDEHNAVIVLNIHTGQLELVTAPQVFIPAANQQVFNVSKRIRLEDHETIVIKDRRGRYIFRRGSDEERSFFLDPYSEMVQFRWADERRGRGATGKSLFRRPGTEPVSG